MMSSIGRSGHFFFSIANNTTCMSIEELIEPETWTKWPEAEAIGDIVIDRYEEWVIHWTRRRMHSFAGSIKAHSREGVAD